MSILEESFHRLRRAFDEEAGRAAASRFTEALEAQLTAGAPPSSPKAAEDAR